MGTFMFFSPFGSGQPKVGSLPTMSEILEEPAELVQIFLSVLSTNLLVRKPSLSSSSMAAGPLDQIPVLTADHLATIDDSDILPREVEVSPTIERITLLVEIPASMAEVLTIIVGHVRAIVEDDFSSVFHCLFLRL
jgi:hypothetical protein